MHCPYCHAEMKQGHLKIQKSMPVWYGDDENVSNLDRALGGIGVLIPPKKTPLYAIFPASYCSSCRKMILDTDITK